MQPLWLEHCIPHSRTDPTIVAQRRSSSKIISVTLRWKNLVSRPSLCAASMCCSRIKRWRKSTFIFFIATSMQLFTFSVFTYVGTVVSCKFTHCKGLQWLSSSAANAACSDTSNKTHINKMSSLGFFFLSFIFQPPS